MDPSVRLLLALLPLAGYFLVLGSWNAGRRARVVPGPIDAALLAIALGGLIAFGPVGGLVVERLFPRPSLAAWLAVASFVGLVGLYMVARARRRVMVYHVGQDVLIEAIAHAMDRLAGPVQRTLRGFEDLEGGRGVSVEFGRWLGSAVIEAHGDRAESLADALPPAITSCLKGQDSPASKLAALWFGLGFATAALLAASVALLTRPEARALIRRIGGG